MDDQGAAGRKTGDRAARIAAGLEQNFEQCRQILADCLATVAKRGGYRDEDLRATAMFLRTSAQIAGVIARIETAKNRGSIPQ